MFDDFKIEILINLTKQVEMLRMQDEGKENADICVVESHDVKCFSSLPRLKEVHQEENGTSQLPMQQSYVALRGPWQPIKHDMRKETN